MLSEAQRRLAAVVSADVAGYSRLMGRNERGTLAALKAHQVELIDPAVASHGGRIVKTTGDGILLEFPSVVSAVNCCVAVQDGMALRNASVAEDDVIQFRVGIHLGDIIVDGDDIFGDGVNIAARLQEAAQPGGIAISAVVHDYLDTETARWFVDLGEREFKNIRRAIRIWQRTTDAAAGSQEPLALPDKPSIAVLPFDNMSNDPNEDYFSDGISEDLTTALSRFDGLFVIGRNSAFRYKDKSLDLKIIGRELGVRYILEGSVRRAGDRVRVNAQLVNAVDDRHVWAERYDRKMDDIFELQDDIVANIAAAVGPEITLAEIERARSRQPNILDAWDLHLRGLAEYYKMTQESLAEAVSLLENALEIDPELARARALLSLSHLHIGLHGWTQPVRRAFGEARRLAEDAVRRAPSSPEAHHALAFVHLTAGEPEIAVAAAKRAINLNPNFAEAYAVLGLALTFKGDLEAGLEASKIAARSNPREARGQSILNGMAHAYHMLGEYERAIEAATNGLQMDSSNYGCMVVLAASYARLGRLEDAKRHVNQLLDLIPRFSLRALRKNPMYVRPDHIEKLIEGMRIAGVPE